MANTSNDSRIVNEQVKSLKLGDTVVKSVTLPATIVESVGKGNEGVVIGGTAANPTVGVQVSAETDNGLQIKDSGNKGLYVSAKTLGLSTAYIPKGSMTVAQSATNLTNGEVGWVYNMSDAGEVANGVEGTITVKAGDNLVIVNTGTDASPVKKWDKLSATIDVPVYTGSGAIKVTGTVISLDNGNGLNQNNNTLGLTLADNSLSVDGSGLKTNLKTNGGLNLDTTAGSGGIEVKTGNGLEITTGTDAGKVQVKAADASISVSGTGVSVNKAGGLAVDGGLKVDVDGATIKLDTNGKVALKAAAAGGLDTSDGTNGVSVKTGGGLQKDPSAGTISVKANANKAIEVDASSGVGVVAGSNIAVASTGVVVDIDKSTTITNDTTIEGVITLLGGTITAAS